MSCFDIYTDLRCDETTAEEVLSRYFKYFESDTTRLDDDSNVNIKVCSGVPYFYCGGHVSDIYFRNDYENDSNESTTLYLNRKSTEMKLPDKSCKLSIDDIVEMMEPLCEVKMTGEFKSHFTILSPTKFSVTILPKKRVGSGKVMVIIVISDENIECGDDLFKSIKKNKNVMKRHPLVWTGDRLYHVKYCGNMVACRADGEVIFNNHVN